MRGSLGNSGPAGRNKKIGQPAWYRIRPPELNYRLIAHVARTRLALLRQPTCFIS
jgi:hypothetical protein